MIRLMFLILFLMLSMRCITGDLFSRLKQKVDCENSVYNVHAFCYFTEFLNLFFDAVPVVVLSISAMKQLKFISCVWIREHD